MQPFSQIGPPRNLTLEVTEDGDFRLTWERPEYGLETLRFYILKWWLEPGNAMYGEIKTPDYEYTGKLFFLNYNKQDLGSCSTFNWITEFSVPHLK